MRVAVVTPPEAILTVADARRQLRLDEGDDDAFLAVAIAAATAAIDGPEGWLGRSIGRQTLEARLDHFGGDALGAIVLRYPPIHQVESVKYLDGDGVEQTVAANTYELRGRTLGPIYGGSWPSARGHPEAVRVRYVAGYDPVPEVIKQAVLLMVADLWRNRGTVTIGATATQTPMSTTVENLLASYRVFH